MQDPRSPRTSEPATETGSGKTPAPASAGRRIDCGAAPDDRPVHARRERGDARHAYLTARGMYADQVQAI